MGVYTGVYFFYFKMKDFCANCKQTTVGKNCRVLKDHRVGVYCEYLAANAFFQTGR